MSNKTVQTQADAITYTVLWHAFISIAEEMGATLRRTAFSEAVREGEDFSTAIFDRHGRMLAQGNFTPGHLGSIPYVVKTVLEYFPAETLQPGDGIVQNDMRIGSGHYPDIFLVSPIFAGDQLVGFSANCAHHVDVGGAVAGSQAVKGISEAQQEGLRLLPVKLYRGGEIDRDIERIILGNVRLPDKVLGDLRAQRNANRIGELRYLDLRGKYGLALMDEASDWLINQTEAAMRAAIQAIPDGEYSFTDHLDDYGPGTEPVRAHVTIRVKGGDVEVDFTGSSAQVAGAVNSYFNYTRAYTVFALKSVTEPLLPQNEGGLRPMSLIAPEGSFFNPNHPAPGGGRATVQIRIFEAINGALAQAIPDKAMGAFSHWSNPNVSGVHPETGSKFIYYDLILGGYGARSYKDGVEGACPVFNARNVPIEVHETNNPIIVRRLEFVRDSSGAGKFRGGSAVRKDVEVLAPSVLSALADRHIFEPYGLFGGHPGQKARTVITDESGERDIGSKDTVSLPAGATIRFQVNGAGGYGPPLERDPELVLRDLFDDYITPATARDIYGVVLSAGGDAVDGEATRRLRAELAAQARP